MNERQSIALYERRRAELVLLLGEVRVQQIEQEIGDDYLIYGVRSSVPLRGLFDPK